MTFFFDVTPFVVLAGLIAVFAIALILRSVYRLLLRLIVIPFVHKKTKLKLYEFRNHNFETKKWLKGDAEAKLYQAKGKFYSFATKEIYPQNRYLETE